MIAHRAGDRPTTRELTRPAKRLSLALYGPLLATPDIQA